MTTLNVTVSQSRVANPFGREIAEYLIIKDSYDMAHIVPSVKADEWSSDYGYQAVAKVNVNRPAVMAGDVEDDILYIIKEEAIKEKICITNVAGTLFVK